MYCIYEFWNDHFGRNFGMIILGGDKIFFTFLCLGTPPPWNGFRTRKVKSMCLLVRFNQRALKPPKAGGPLPPLANGQNFPSLFFQDFPDVHILARKNLQRKCVQSKKLQSKSWQSPLSQVGFLPAGKVLARDKESERGRSRWLAQK